MNKYSYEKYAIVQRESAKYLLHIIKNLEYKNALDIGSGTGFLTKYLKNPISFDIDKSLKTFHKSFVVGNIEYLPFKDKSFDLVISNFTLHLCNVENSLKEMLRVSRKYVAGSFPIEGSLKGWIYDFPKENEVLRLLEKKYIKYWDKRIYNLNFKGLELLKFITITGKPKAKYNKGFIKKSEIKNILSKLEKVQFNVLSFLLEV